MSGIIGGILIPFMGTIIGSMMVFATRGEMNNKIQRGLLGFAAGIMVAASVWSLLIPAMNHVSDLGRLAFVPAVIGFLGGMVVLKYLDKVIPHQQLNLAKTSENTSDGVSKLVMAVTIHNLPEGMAVGAIVAGLLSGDSIITEAGVIAVALGIGIQNIPEGAIVSIPLASSGMSKKNAFLYSFVSGVVEPLGAILTILAAGIMVPILPYMLGFAAGAMIYVVVEEIVPEMTEGDKNGIGTTAFFMGFSLMMMLDVALG